jgi:FMN phosphatase YigB (HAD superfamily)
MKIFFDFDDVLFNTKEFKEGYRSIFEKRGVSKKIFEECYYDPLDEGNIKKYDIISHIERICRKTNQDCIIFEKEAEDFVIDTSRFVFSEVPEILGHFPRKDLNILSFSQTNFQKSKITGSGLLEYFNQVKIVNTLKGEAMNEIIHQEGLLNEEMYFIDDRVEQIESVKKKCPQVKTILFSRPEGRWHDRKNKYCDYRVTTLKGVEEIIKNK